MIRVLSIGRDRLLVAIRTMILRRAGYRVHEAYSPLDARRLVDSWKFDLVLICHSVPESEQTELISAVRFARPELPILSISSRKHYTDHETCSIVDLASSAILTEINTVLRNTGAQRVA